MKYEMAELLPLVKELTEKYTSKASTSVTYETAQQLMGAVLFCIGKAEKCGGDFESGSSYAEGSGERSEDSQKINTDLIGDQGLSAREAWKVGYDRIIRKTQEAQGRYAEMIQVFHGYGNLAYETTVTKSIPQFFNWYDARFFPQQDVTELDYPVLVSLTEKQGIDYVSEYVACISMEQRFLSKLSCEYAEKVLALHHPRHRELIINLCSIILKRILVNMLIDIPLQQTELKPNDYERLDFEVKRYGKESLLKKLWELLTLLIDGVYESDKKMLIYFQNCIPEIAAELISGVENGYLDKVI